MSSNSTTINQSSAEQAKRSANQRSGDLLPVKAGATTLKTSSSDIVGVSRQAHEAKHNQLVEMSKSPFLDDDALASSRKVGKAIGTLASETGKGATEVIKGFANQFVSGLKLLTTDLPAPKKIEALRVPLLGVGTAAFSLLATKSGIDFVKNIFSKERGGLPLTWSGLQFLVGGTMAAGLFRTITGKAKAFGKMSSVVMGSLAYLLVSVMNSIYNKKGKTNNILENIGGKKTTGLIRSMMDLFRSPKSLAGAASGMGVYANMEPDGASVNTSRQINNARQQADQATSGMMSNMDGAINASQS